MPSSRDLASRDLASRDLDPAWSALRGALADIRSTRTADLFRADPARFEKLSFRLDDLLIDFSKCKLTPEVLDLLVDLAERAGVPAAREAMFSGKAINVTENRAVLHTALRDFSGKPVMLLSASGGPLGGARFSCSLPVWQADADPDAGEDPDDDADGAPGR